MDRGRDEVDEVRFRGGGGRVGGAGEGEGDQGLGEKGINIKRKGGGVGGPGREISFLFLMVEEKGVEQPLTPIFAISFFFK